MEKYFIGPFNMRGFKIIGLTVFLFYLVSCSPTREERIETLFKNQCAGCHMAPSPEDLPKHLWETSVLPDMGARMGIRDSTYSPYVGLPFSEQEQMIRSGVYNQKPTISREAWALLKDYIIQMAPDSLPKIPHRDFKKGLTLFKQKEINLDSIPGSSITFLEIENEGGAIITANLKGDISKYDFKKNKTIKRDNFEMPITWYSNSKNVDYVTMVGILDPSERKRGKIFKVSNESLDQIAMDMHRPVHSTIYDFDNDGKDEVLVSEFGHLTGALCLWELVGERYKKNVLLGQPGIIRTIVKDMNNDGKADIILLSTQGNEGITILYQTAPLSFQSETVIRFSPVYGSSWFDLLDYDGDGDEDIITVHGDNADKTYVHKPYHGMRIHINDGANNFEEKYFFPMYGATRFTANDFDEDGDIDIALVSSFPSYQESSDFSFVYLENKDAKNFKFEMFGLDEPSLGRWLLIDSNDIDGDGDKDIVLSTFSYYFNPVPKDLLKDWRKSDLDFMVLENTKR
ncbi:MAG: VCBS repeat-containing protein [Flavobacteriaceae bacterium]